MQKIKDIYKIFFNNYLILLLTIFGIISSLTYSFSGLQIGTTGGLIFRVILGVLFILTVAPGLIGKKARIPLLLFVLSVIYLITNVVVIFVSPLIYSTSVSLLTQFSGIAQGLINVGCIYLIFFLLNSYQASEKSLRFVFYIVIGFVSFLCIYSYIFQFQNIINTFRPVTDCKYCGWNADVTSIYYTKTVYGFMLLIGSIFTLIYAILKKKYWYLLLTLFFVLNMFISRSKTSILTIGVLIVLLGIYYASKYRKTILKKWYIPLSLICVIAVLIILTVVKVGPFFEKINYFISSTIFGDAATVLSDRFYRWGSVTTTINNPLSILFGLGERINNPILQNLIGFGASDSCYVYIYSCGGILYCSICLLVLAWIIKKLLHKKCKILLILLFSLLINFFFETNGFIGIAYNQVLILVSIMLFFKIESQKNVNHKTNVAFISNSFNNVGGIEKITCDLGSELVKTHNVFLFNINSEYDLKYQINERVHKINIKTKKNKKLFIVIKVIREMHKNHIDTMIIQDINLGYLTYINILPISKSKIIFCDHSSFNYYLTNNITNEIVRRKKYAKFADYVSVLTNDNVPLYINVLKKSTESVVCIPNFVNIDNSSIIYDSKSKVITAVGRLHKQKRFDLLIKSFAIIADKYPDWKLEIYGKGEEENNLNILISQYKLQNSCILKGNYNTMDEAYMNKAFLVATSEFEGFGIMILEAVSYKLPVISFNTMSGPSDMIVNGRTGFIVNQSDTDEFATKIEELISNIDLRIKMSNSASQIESIFLKEKIIEKWNKILLL